MGILTIVTSMPLNLADIDRGAYWDVLKHLVIKWSPRWDWGPNGSLNTIISEYRSGLTLAHCRLNEPCCAAPDPSWSFNDLPPSLETLTLRTCTCAPGKPSSDPWDGFPQMLCALKDTSARLPNDLILEIHDKNGASANLSCYDELFEALAQLVSVYKGRVHILRWCSPEDFDIAKRMSKLQALLRWGEVLSHWSRSSVPDLMLEGS